MLLLWCCIILFFIVWCLNQKITWLCITYIYESIIFYAEIFGPEEEEFFQGVGKASSWQWVEHRGSFAKALPVSALSQKLAYETILLTFTPSPSSPCFRKRNNNLWKVTSKFSWFSIVPK